MKQLELFWDTLIPLLDRLSEEEKVRISIAFTRVRDSFFRLEKKYNLAIQNRSAVHTLLTKTSEDLIQRYQTLFEHSGTAMLVIEDDCIISLTNSLFEKLFGYSREEVENKKVFVDFLTEEYREILLENHRRRRDQDTLIPDHYEAKAVTKEGRVLDIAISVGLFPDTRQSIVSIINITKMKEAEDELRKSEERYRLLLQHVSDGVIVHTVSTDGPGKILEVNDRICQILGFSREELLGMSVRDLDVPEQQKNIPQLSDQVLSDKYSVFETEYFRKDRTRILVEISAHLFELQGETTVLAVIRDITERKIVEEEREYYTTELQQHALALQQANAKLNLLNRITRHDLNNQLTAIIGYLDLEKEEFPDPKLQEYLAIQSRAAANIKEQIQFTTEYQDVGIKSPRWFDIRGVIQAAAASLTLPRIQLAISGEDWEIYADPLIVKVFYTLLENAVRHGERVTRIDFSFHEVDTGLVIVYEDNGTGVPAEYKDDIFNQKYFKHTGFGLFLTATILHITGITIMEDGVYGTGARFKILVPASCYRYPDVKTAVS